MFQFTTTTVINSAKDLSTGKPLWVYDTSKKEFRVKRVANFKNLNVSAIYKTTAVNPELAKVAFAIPSSDEGAILRLSLYIGLSEASQNSKYSNDFYCKGKPFSVEVMYKTSPINTASKLKETIDKYQVMVFGERLLNVSTNGAYFIIEAVDEYQRFKVVNLEKLIPADPSKGKYMDEFEVIKNLDQIKEHTVASNSLVDGKTNDKFFPGKEGFGTYSFLLHNLRIPTFENTRPFGVGQAEAPIPGALYDEYVVHYSVNRGILGSNGVGDQVTSMTTHVFYVNQAAGTPAQESGKGGEDFATAIAHLGTVTTVSKAPTANPEVLPQKQNKLTAGSGVTIKNDTITVP